jgi:integrase
VSRRRYLRCDWIKPEHLTAFRDRRRAQGVKAQTINLDVIAFGNALRYAVDRGWVAAVPRVKPLKAQPRRKRRLLTPAEIERLLDHCNPDVIKNADLVRFYLHFLSLTGARKEEALRVRWEDVDFDRRQVTIGAAGDAKGGHHRTVDFTPELAAFLHEMHAGRQPTTAEWLGHRDGGVLVGKIYGHLSDDHKARMAAGLSLLRPPV